MLLQHNAVVTDEIRNKFNSLHELFFNIAMIILAPLVAFMAWLSNEYLKHDDTASLMGAMAVLFLVTSVGHHATGGVLCTASAAITLVFIGTRCVIALERCSLDL